MNYDIKLINNGKDFKVVYPNRDNYDWNDLVSNSTWDECAKYNIDPDED